MGTNKVMKTDKAKVQLFFGSSNLLVSTNMGVKCIDYLVIGKTWGRSHHFHQHGRRSESGHTRQ